MDTEPTERKGRRVSPLVAVAAGMLMLVAFIVFMTWPLLISQLGPDALGEARVELPESGTPLPRPTYPPTPTALPCYELSEEDVEIVEHFIQSMNSPDEGWALLRGARVELPGGGHTISFVRRKPLHDTRRLEHLVCGEHLPDYVGQIHRGCSAVPPEARSYSPQIGESVIAAALRAGWECEWAFGPYE